MTVTLFTITRGRACCLQDVSVSMGRISTHGSHESATTQWAPAGILCIVALSTCSMAHQVQKMITQHICHGQEPTKWTEHTVTSCANSHACSIAVCMTQLDLPEQEPSPALPTTASPVAHWRFAIIPHLLGICDPGPLHLLAKQAARTELLHPVASDDHLRGMNLNILGRRHSV